MCSTVMCGTLALIGHSYMACLWSSFYPFLFILCRRMCHIIANLVQMYDVCIAGEIAGGWTYRSNKKIESYRTNSMCHIYIDLSDYLKIRFHLQFFLPTTEFVFYASVFVFDFGRKSNLRTKYFLYHFWFLFSQHIYSWVWVPFLCFFIECTL